MSIRIKSTEEAERFTESKGGKITICHECLDVFGVFGDVENFICDECGGVLD
jgi:hypothetical protein